MYLYKKEHKKSRGWFRRVCQKLPVVTAAMMATAVFLSGCGHDASQTGEEATPSDGSILYVKDAPGDLPEDLQNLPGIDVVRGMSYCGTGDAYRKTLFLFREQIPGYLRRIRQDWEEEKWEDYSIEVHSLKSAARWIGAMDLGDNAEALEMAGRGGDLEKVNARTEDLLEQCQKLGDALAFL